MTDKKQLGIYIPKELNSRLQRIIARKNKEIVDKEGSPLSTSKFVKNIIENHVVSEEKKAGKT